MRGNDKRRVNRRHAKVALADMSRAYCLADKPFPVSARALRYLARMDGIIWAWWEIAEAPRIYERLRLGGYVRFDEPRLYAQITDAGRALLARDATKAT